MASGKKVFIIGPGFIGWNVVELLVKEGYSVTGYVRRKEHADGIKASGADVVMGDLDDTAKITEQVTQFDVVIHTATADHLPSVEAVIDGIKKRAAKGQMTSFIHTSGASVLDDGSKGSARSDRVYSDKTRHDIDTVPDDAPHRPIDLAIVKAQKELAGKAKLAIIVPPLIYGYTHGRGTIQLPTLARFGLKHGYVPYIDKGLGIGANIHVLDLARAYIYILHHLESSTPEQTLENPYFFCEGSGDAEPSWKEYAQGVAASLHQAGAKVEPEPRSLTSEELYGDLLGPYTTAVFAMNTRNRAERLRGLGWEAREKGWKQSWVEDELPRVLEEGETRFGGYAPIGDKA